MPAIWLFQVPLWVVIPVWLGRETERAHAPARWLFALLLAFVAVGSYRRQAQSSPGIKLDSSVPDDWLDQRNAKSVYHLAVPVRKLF